MWSKYVSGSLNFINLTILKERLKKKITKQKLKSFTKIVMSTMKKVTFTEIEISIIGRADTPVCIWDKHTVKQ